MITRFALFEGHVEPPHAGALRAAVLAEVLPPILALDYPDRAAVDTALASPQRALAKAAMEAVQARYFVGAVHHHIAQAHGHSDGGQASVAALSWRPARRSPPT